MKMIKPPQEVKCITNFTLYIADKKKSKSNTKVWVPATDFSAFQKLVISEWESAVTNAGVKIQEALALGSPKIEWAVSIPGFPDNYAFWIETLPSLVCLDAGLTLTRAVSMALACKCFHITFF
ncbi:hypothetical protein VP01_1678g3 [Puccinia sorghi]|uniref:Uncharacterized protein n=1 Tax=Puccinia sorghi TaxID=27349 RepID=A0A0L6VHW0_9BASI|nr:hypothetical protein VP01_1678g3 [Puccinia sorghi]